MMMDMTDTLRCAIYYMLDERNIFMMISYYLRVLVSYSPLSRRIMASSANANIQQDATSLFIICRNDRSGEEPRSAKTLPLTRLVWRYEAFDARPVMQQIPCRNRQYATSLHGGEQQSTFRRCRRRRYSSAQMIIEIAAPTKRAKSASATLNTTCRQILESKGKVGGRKIHFHIMPSIVLDDDVFGI